MSSPLILASSSAYRKALLSRLGLGFDVVRPDVDETPRAGESFVDTAMRLAREKAVWVAQRQPAAVVIGSDQVAACAGQRLDKPGNADNALAQLQLQRGHVSEFHTAVCVASDAGRCIEEALVTTHVRFKGEDSISDEMLKAYIALEKPFDCAGAAKSEGLGIVLISSIQGPDPTALVGLPLIALTGLLAKFGVTPLGKSPP